MANTPTTTHGALSTNEPTYFSTSTELADLGRERFDHDTAAIGDRDFALYAERLITLQGGRAPRGLESQVFAWNSFQYVAEERNDLEALKGDLHEGQLHRQNRAARAGGVPPEPVPRGGAGGGRGGGAWKNGGMGVGGGGHARGHGQGVLEPLYAGRKPEGRAPPLAKGWPEELDRSMFWDGPIV